MRRLILVVFATALLASACGGGSSPAPDPTPSAANGGPPHIAAFLKLPVATPSACPSGDNGQTIGRTSPWVGHIDISVFLKNGLTTKQQAKLGTTLRHAHLVKHVYFESQAEAYQEFQRLYTCWKSVPESDTPASYRMVLYQVITLAQRNALVAQIEADPGVDGVSCNPSVPCTDISPNPTPTGLAPPINSISPTSGS